VERASRPGGMPHKQRGEHDLRRMSDDELVDHLRSARAHGDRDGARLALQMLVFGYMDHVAARVALKVPWESVDEVAGHALASALTGAFRGQSVGEFRAWLHTIVDRRIADFYRAGRVEVLPITDEHRELASGEDEATAVAVRSVVEDALRELSPVHRRAIELYVFHGLSAEETAREVDVQPGNVHKIAQRFRDRVRSALNEDSEVIAS
jgi:RNA polymerase sigma factor (sigma-70 family)